jgi:hypothetical protein
MKKNHLSLIITSVIVACFDILSLLLRKEFNSNFWFGFGFVQFGWLIHALLSFMVDESSEEQRGIKPLEFINVSNIIIMIIMAIVYYAIPQVKNIRLLIVPYVILYGFYVVGIVLSLYNIRIIKKQCDENKQI